MVHFKGNVTRRVRARRVWEIVLFAQEHMESSHKTEDEDIWKDSKHYPERE